MKLQKLKKTSRCISTSSRSLWTLIWQPCIARYFKRTKIPLFSCTALRTSTIYSGKSPFSTTWRLNYSRKMSSLETRFISTHLMLTSSAFLKAFHCVQGHQKTWMAQRLVPGSSQSQAYRTSSCSHLVRKPTTMRNSRAGHSPMKLSTSFWKRLRMACHQS